MCRAALLAALAMQRAVSMATMYRVSLEKISPESLCTDGSPASYYWRPALNQASESRWIIMLQGGGWCWDKESCERRCGTPEEPWHDNWLCSSRDYPDELPLEGNMWPIDGSFHKYEAANLVFLKYCTSDAHMGNASAFGWQFRGSVVVQAVIQDLVRRRGLGSVPQQLLFTGGSAGARGAMANLEYLPEMMGSQAAANVDILSFLDSPLLLDVEPLSGSNFCGFRKVAQSVYHTYNSPRLGSECQEAQVPEERWKCALGEYRMHFVKMPYLMVASQYDTFQLGSNIGGNPTTDEEFAFAELFAERTRNVSENLWRKFPSRVPGALRNSSVLSWACYNHHMGKSESGFTAITAAGESMASALYQFLDPERSTDPNQLKLIDSCTSFECGSGCSSYVFGRKLAEQEEDDELDVSSSSVLAIFGGIAGAFAMMSYTAVLTSRRRRTRLAALEVESVHLAEGSDAGSAKANQK